MKYGARNQLAGTITEIKRGGVMAHVKLDATAEGSLSSVLTLESLEDLGINEGDKVKVIVKAVNVILVKE